jgi:hypothetical protein
MSSFITKWLSNTYPCGTHWNPDETRPKGCFAVTIEHDNMPCCRFRLRVRARNLIDKDQRREDVADLVNLGRVTLYRALS